MAGYYEQKYSKAAIWCLRLAIFAVPFLATVVYLQRTRAIEAVQAFWLLAVGIAIITGSILLGIRAAMDLWENGYKGGRKTVNGLALSSLLLVPFGYQLALALENPKLNDLATDIADPPKFLSSDKMIGYSPSYNLVDSEIIFTAYPEIKARRYNAPTQRVFKSAEFIIKSWKWNIIDSLNIPEIKVVAETTSESVEVLDGGPNEDADLPEADEQKQIVLQVVAKSMILKLDSHIVIRLTPEDDTTLVDVRARSEWGPHDFGSNAKNIQWFLQELDLSLAGVAGES